MGATDDTTSFAYGSDGSVVPTADLSVSQRGKQVRFQYPIQKDDILVLEVKDSNAGDHWMPVNTGLGSSIQTLEYQVQNGITYGMGLRTNISGSTDVTVLFGQYAKPTSTYGAAGTLWTALTTWKWRVRKAKASAPVGFGLAGTDGSAGLYKAGQAPGLTTGATISAGYVGQIYNTVSWDDTALTTVTGRTIGTMTLPAGVWMVIGKGKLLVNATGTVSNAYISISLFPNTVDDTYLTSVCNPDTADSKHIPAPNRIVNTTGGNVYLVAYATFSGGATVTPSSGSSIFYAVRIA
jgi:hypothetical protein